jgi:hypothetical protein
VVQRAAAAALVLLAVVAVAPGLTADFTHFDDPLYLTLNARMARPGLEGSLALWSPADAWNGRFVEYFPLRDSVYWVLWQWLGPRSVPFHLVSLLFHVACVLLVRALGQKLGLSARASLVAAALFAVHPAHLESVVWVAGLKDPMYVFFTLGFLWLQLSARERGSKRLEWASWAALVAALLCKSMAIVAPVWLVLCEQTREERPPWSKTLRAAAVPALLSGLFLAHFLVIARIAHVVVPPHGGSLRAHVTLAVWAQVRYLAQALAPADLRFIHCFSPPSPFDPRLFAGLALLAGLGVLLWKGSRQVKLSVGLYLAALLPVANVLPFPAVVADRYLYAASVGVCFGLALALERLRPSWSRVAPVVLVGTWLIISFTAALDWRDEEQLYVTADEDPACMTDPSNYASKAHFQRGLVAHDDRTALDAFQRTLDAAGSRQLSGPQRCGVLLQASVRAARVRGAPFVAWTDQFIAQCPTVQTAWFMGAMAALGRDGELAVTRARRAVELRAAPDARTALGVALLETGAVVEATATLDEALTSDPRSACAVVRSWVALGGDRPAAAQVWVVRCEKISP